MNNDAEKRTVRCAICGGNQYKSILERKHNMNKSYLDISTNDYGWNDIDYRIEECPHCAYLAEDISKLSYGWHKVKNMKFLDEAADVYNKCAFAMSEMNDVLGEYKYHSMSAWRSGVIGDNENRAKSLWKMYSIYENFKHKYDFKQVEMFTIREIETELGICKINKKCAVCGHVSEQKKTDIKPDTHFFHPSQDADFRPTEPFRDTITLWLEKCPNCGYVDKDISNESSNLLGMIETKDYLIFQKRVNWNKFYPDFAKKFILYALAKEHLGEYDEAYKSVVCAAWIADDVKAQEHARIYRRRASNIFNKYFDINTVNIRDALRHLDVLRRAEMYGEVVKICDTLPVDPNPVYENLKKLQKKLASDKDNTKYFIESSLYCGE